MTTKPIEFDRERASQYNLDIRKAIPGYEALHGMAQNLLRTNLSSSARLLVVGSGTGMELINFCQQNSQWILTGVDPSQDMMIIARQELAKRKLLARVNLHRGDLDSLPQTEPMDAATLILVMHFLPDDGSKLELLKNIARRLKPGAEFILADLHGDKSARYFTKLKTAWQAHYFNQLDDANKTQAESEFETRIDNSIHFISEARIRELLNTAGFDLVSKFYNAFLFGGWTAKFTGS